MMYFNYNSKPEKEEPKVIYFCDMTNPRVPCSKTGCILNGGPCCCTTDWRNSLHDTHKKRMVCDQKIVDGVCETVSFMFEHYDDDNAVKEYIWTYMQMFGIGGFYLNAKVLSFDEFMNSYAGPEAYDVFKREGSIEDYAEAHGLRYTKTLYLSRKAHVAYEIYKSASYVPLARGTMILFVHYYSTKLNCDPNLYKRVASALCNRYNTINELLSATDNDISQVMNLGVKTIPIAIQLRDMIRKEMGWKDEPGTEA